MRILIRTEVRILPVSTSADLHFTPGRTGHLLNLSDGSGTIDAGPLDSKRQRRWHVGLGTMVVWNSEIWWTDWQRT